MTTFPSVRQSGPATALTTIGICCVVLGGGTAAVTEPLELSHGSWTAAYLVLVGGVAQCAMGFARSRCPAVRQPSGWGWAQVGAWNLGNASVIGGTWAGQSRWVDIGSMLLLIGLVLALHATRRSPGRSASRAAWAYRALLLVVMASIPVGIVLSHLRHG